MRHPALRHRALRAVAMAVALVTAGTAAAQQAPSGDAPASVQAPVSVAPPVTAPPDLPGSIIPAPPDGAGAQQSPVLTVDQDLLYFRSAWGLRAETVVQAQGAVIAAENERLTLLLSTEEADLTARRAILPPADFRRLAEEFDLRATRIRRERAQAVQDLNQWADSDRAAFFGAALSVMGRLMQDRGAVAVLDRRTVFVSLDAIDVTEPLVAMVNATLGDGAGAVPLPQPGEAPPDGTDPPQAAPPDALPAPSGQPGDPLPDQVE